jgi:hypothetical protein
VKVPVIGPRDAEERGRHGRERAAHPGKTRGGFQASLPFVILRPIPPPPPSPSLFLFSALSRPPSPAAPLFPPRYRSSPTTSLPPLSLLRVLALLLLNLLPFLTSPPPPPTACRPRPGSPATSAGAPTRARASPWSSRCRLRRRAGAGARAPCPCRRTRRRP